MGGMPPKAKARLAGVFEALEGLPAAFGQTAVIGMLVVNSDAAKTASNILSHQTLYRLGFAIPLVAVGFHIVWALLVYQLMRPVHRTINQLALLAIMVGCALQAMAAVFFLGPLVVLQNTTSASGLAASQQQALAMMAINLSRQTFNAYLIFFGLWCVLIGYLIFRSTFLPRILGVLLMLDGIGWMLFLWQPLATAVYPAIATMGGLAEFPLLLWFLIRGVDSRRWTEQALAAGLAVA
jgi:uncharacterized protein DUF4386